ncbi:MAG TPA: hypothetical protein PLL10_03980 [Elusimicrobiales bacterium]|nr:hypothetical protein [Elusimicrobiales bacterium]
MHKFNRRLMLSLFTAGIVLTLSACAANLKKAMPPIEDVLHAGPLAKLVVYVGNIPLGESGPSPEGMTISIGGTAILSAQGRDANNRPIKVVPSWTASKPELAQISPSTGEMVAVKGLREGTVEIVVEFKGVKRTINYIFIK